MPRSTSINLIIRGHPEQRMKERQITRANIERAIRSCYSDTPADAGGYCHEGYGEGRRILKVWTMPPLSHEGDIIVKSAAWKGGR